MLNVVSNPVIHPTKKEYEVMDRIRFPFMFKEEGKTREKLYNKIHEIKLEGNRHKLKERIKKLIGENKERFFDPRIKKEIQPIAKRNSGGWAEKEVA